MPGLGDEPLPPGVEDDPGEVPDLLSRWRAAGAQRGASEAHRRGWDSFLVVTDSHGSPTAVAIARLNRDSVAGLAVGHASLSHGSEGDCAPMRGGIWDAMGQLATQGSEALARYGIAQMTRGAVSEELADQILERFPDMDLVSAMVEALGRDPEPIGEDLAELGLPLLLAKHEGCLGRTDEGFEDIVASFPDAATVICPEACTSSPAFAQALREFSTHALGD